MRYPLIPNFNQTLSVYKWSFTQKFITKKIAIHSIKRSYSCLTNKKLKLLNSFARVLVLTGNTLSMSTHLSKFNHITIIKRFAGKQPTNLGKIIGEIKPIPPALPPTNVSSTNPVSPQYNRSRSPSPEKDNNPNNLKPMSKQPSLRETVESANPDKINTTPFFGSSRTQNVYKRGYARDTTHNYLPTPDTNNVLTNERETYDILPICIVGHINKLKLVCDQENCITLKCNGLCGNIQYLLHIGNFTHNPPASSNYILVSEYDINGNRQDQYFVFSNNNTRFTNDPTSSSDSGLKYSKNADDYNDKHF